MDYGAAIIAGELRSMELTEPAAAAAAVYDQPIGVRLLYEDRGGGEEHYLVRYPAGLRGRAHQHTAAHTIVVLDGELDANGHVIGPGSYAHFPAGQVMRHQAADEAACLLLGLVQASAENGQPAAGGRLVASRSRGLILASAPSGRTRCA